MHGASLGELDEQMNLNHDLHGGHLSVPTHVTEVSLEKCAVADLQDLPFYAAAHLTGQIEAGVGLIDRFGLRQININVLSCILQHFVPTGLGTIHPFGGSRGLCGSRRDGIAANVCFAETHGHVLCQ